MGKYIQISIFTGKRLWWRPFKYSCCYEDLQLYQKLALSQILSCETCEVLQNTIFKENCWSTASDFWEHFGWITCFISNKSTNFLWLPETAVSTQLTVFSLEILKDNQNRGKVVEKTILLMKSTQQRKWMAFSRSSHVSQKKGDLKY